MNFTTSADAVAYLESLATRPPDALDALPATERQAARLPHLRELLALLGNPQEQLRVAHVTGTSGKGSTATMLAAIARAAGMRTGLYTNPYIISPQERIQIDGAYIDDAEFVACTALVATAATVLAARHPDRHPHLKEIWVAVTLLAFARANVAVPVVEVGMGGRYDETNVVHPSVAIITNIGWDHMDFLGHSLAAIASHKAGIIKEGAPAIIGVNQPELLDIMRAEAAQAGSTVAVLGQDFAIDTVSTDLNGTHFMYHDDQGDMTAISVPLVGQHQATNAALAIRAAHQLFPDVAATQLRAGLGAAWLPGRFEIVQRQPLVILDAAHNPDKVRALVATVHQTLAGRTIWLIFGALSTKECDPMLAALATLHPHLIATMPTVVGRTAAPAAHLAAMAANHGLSAATYADPHRAIDYALDQASQDDVVLITGSLFLISQVRQRWHGAQRPT